MSEMSSHDPFGHLQHKLLSKEGAESQIGSLTPNHTDAFLSPLLNPLEGLSMSSCGKLGLEGCS
jgi:hypothetical protein